MGADDESLQQKNKDRRAEFTWTGLQTSNQDSEEERR